MIIDLILDRNAGIAYNAKEFSQYCKEEEEVFNMPYNIAGAIESKTEQEVKHAICDYIINEGYAPKICDFVNSINWKE